jgi:hypothetical protein
MRGITMLRIVVFLGNLGIVFYMLYLLRAGRRLRASLPPVDAETGTGSDS